MSKYASLFLGKDTDSDDKGAAHNASTSYSILFVDDEPNVLSALRRVFRREKYNLLTATSALEGLKLLAEQTVQVVVSDFKMPGMDGAKFLRRVKEDYPFTIRIMLTGHADVGAVMGAVNEGAVYKFITKPWNDEDLRLTVSLALEQYDLVKENRALKEKNRKTEQQLKKLSQLTSMGQSNLGKVLIRRGLLTPEKLKKANELRARTRDAIPVVLVKLGYIDEKKIFNVIKSEMKIDTISPAEVPISETLFDLIPESYCRKNCVLPLRLEGKKLTLAMADPTDIQLVDDLRFVSGLNVVSVLARVDEINARLDQVSAPDEQGIVQIDELNEFDPYENIEIIEEDDDCDIRELLSAAETPPAIRVVNAIIMESIRLGASDVHIEPKTEHSRVRLRIDGMLVDKIHLPSSFHPPTISRIKVMAGMDIAERRKPQDGRVAIKTARKIVDLRVSSLPTINGEKVVLRLLDRNARIRHIGDLGLPEDQLSRLQRVVKRPNGLVLVVGPTGSGKTTTLYAILRENATIAKNFVTIEDPVEYFMETAEQVYVRERIGLDFASILRSILRQDPDVIMLGEIRDLETASVTFHAAMTGHLVLSTIHANDTTSAITRLRDIGIKSHIISGGLICVVSQRLLRRVCENCREHDSPSPTVLSALGLRENSADFSFYKGAGCDKCHNTGYSGRVGVFEILEVNREIKEMIHEDASEGDIIRLASLTGMRLLRDDAVQKLKNGDTTCDELLRVLGPVNKILCPNCRKPLEETFNCCPFCGEQIRKRCRNCKQLLRPEWVRCPFCGDVTNK